METATATTSERAQERRPEFEKWAAIVAIAAQIVIGVYAYGQLTQKVTDLSEEVHQISVIVQHIQERGK